MKIRLRFYNSFLTCFLGGVIGGGIWVIENQKFPSFILEYPLHIIFAHISVGIIFGAIFRFFPSGNFNENGIRTFNSLSMLRSIQWTDIKSAKKVYLPFFSFLFVYTPSSNWAVWVPLTITNEKLLKEAMLKSNNSVLTKHISI